MRQPIMPSIVLREERDKVQRRKLNNLSHQYGSGVRYVVGCCRLWIKTQTASL
jgi:hypothetical protein